MVDQPMQNDVEISRLEDWCARLAHTQSMCQDQYEMRYLEMQLEEVQRELEQKRQEMSNE